MKRQRMDDYTFSFQAILLLALFLAIGAILMQVFAGAKELSVKTEKRNEGIQICRNVAEIYVGTSGEEAARLLNGTWDGATLYAQPDEEYVLVVKTQKLALPYGEMEHVHISVVCTEIDVQTELETQIYRPYTEESQ